MFSKNATIIDEIFTIDLTLFSKCQIDGEDFVDFCGLLKGQLISKCIFGDFNFFQKYERKHVAH